MLFNSYIFILCFLPVCLLLYFLFNKVNHTLSLISLILMSIWFYGYFNISYVFILLCSIVFNWSISFLLNKVVFRYRKAALLIGILFNIGLILYFKYYDFFIENINTCIKTSFELKHIVLPLGISFFTFQQISYLVDSYRHETKDYSFIEYVAFITFFPQLIAGPIVYHNEFIPQIRNQKNWLFDHSHFAHGIYTFSIGLFKKVLIADTFGTAVSWAWNNIDSLSSLEIIIVTLCYTFQLYFDFSGYCDMAIGLGKMFNIDLPNNFNSPYKSLSITEFWSRWHMTLTRFLRKYIYFPLGGSRHGNIRTYLNVLIVFLISGIWHGANWTFILWGILHGIANILNRVFKNNWETYHPAIRWCFTFFFVNIAWLIFRADNLSQAWALIKKVTQMDSFTVRLDLLNCFYLDEFTLLNFIPQWNTLINTLNGFYLWAFLITAFYVCLNTKNVHDRTFHPTLPKAIITTVMLVWSIISFSGMSTFLYFNF